MKIVDLKFVGELFSEREDFIRAMHQNGLESKLANMSGNVVDIRHYDASDGEEFVESVYQNGEEIMRRGWVVDGDEFSNCGCCSVKTLLEDGKKDFLLMM